jgi:phospholipase C
MITYSNWGGWYDHVEPPQVDGEGYGFRVPALLVSPYARTGYIDSTVMDYTSILKFIEDNYGLQPLSTRDAQANSIASAFDFKQAPRPAQLVSGQAETGPAPEPRRSAIAFAYGLAIALPALVIGWAAVRTSRMSGRGLRGQARSDGNAPL